MSLPVYVGNPGWSHLIGRGRLWGGRTLSQDSAINELRIIRQKPFIPTVFLSFLHLGLSQELADGREL